MLCGSSTRNAVEPSEFGPYRHVDFHSAFRRDTLLPKASGVYAFFVANGDKLIDSIGLDLGDRPELAAPIDGYTHLYTGCSRSLFERMRLHTKGNVQSSNLRHTLLSIENARGALTATGVAVDRTERPDFDLDLWLCRRAHILWWKSEDYLDLEREIIRTVKSPLNITLNRRRSWPLVRMKEEYDQVLFRDRETAA